MMDPADWEFACPQCSSLLVVPRGTSIRARDSQELRLDCPTCGAVYPFRHGIWDFLRESEKPRYERFLADYIKIRSAEGRGSDDPEYFLALPECPAHDPLAPQWEIRGKTFSTFRHRVLAPLGTGLKILDLGAGVGWMSHRLAQMGHFPCAIDINIDDRDGLGAARHYTPAWPRVRAEFDRLPFPEKCVDLVVFNASLHYTTGYGTTVGEALRVLKAEGSLVVLDTPVYQNAASGRKMTEERHVQFEEQYGTRSDSLASRQYLTWNRIGELGRELGLQWMVIRPWYGWKWAARPWLARVRGEREPARFPILIGRRE